MKKLTLVAVTVSIAAIMSGCSHKMHENLMDPNRPKAAAAPKPDPAKDATYIPFTKLKRQQLERNNIDLTQIQFYVDQKIILRRMMGNDREMVKGGTLVTETSRSASELTIPEMTPVVCDRVSGDTLMISFEAPGNDIPFGTPYGSNTYSVLGTNWINGSADVTYDNQTYRIICGSCGNIAEVRLMIKEATVDKPNNASKTIVGRKLGK